MDASELLEEVVAIARSAGDVIPEVYGTAFTAREKADASPVTEADERAETRILILDRAQERLYTVASRGYPDSGVGSADPAGAGRGRRGGARAHAYPHRLRAGRVRIRPRHPRGGPARGARAGDRDPASRASRLAKPAGGAHRGLRARLGVLFVEAAQDRRFGYDDEDALVAVAGQLGAAIHVLQASADADEAPAPAPATAPAPSGPPLAVRHFAENDSVFLGGDYLIKGVAGSIFHALVADFLATGRTEFSNRELRLDARVRLPDLGDNLEARLILLARRLAERNAGIRIEKAGRGRLRLALGQPKKRQGHIDISV